LDPFLWENGKMKDLGNLGGTNGFLGPFVFGLNNRGEVAGQMFLSDEQTRRAFLWDGETLKDLGTLGGSFAGATGLNDRGEVIGFSALPGDQVHHGFLWRGGKMIDLPPVDGDTCGLPLWINSRGQVVGTSSADCQVDFHAVLWENGRAIDLNVFVPSALGIHLVVADNINDRGEIAGGLALPGVTRQQADPGETHVFFLIPCSEEQRAQTKTATRERNTPRARLGTPTGR
jgi:probable HAF family extracellular repeat protein